MHDILLAEDDPVSRHFLCEALQALGRHCEAVADGDAALARAGAHRYRLLLLDYNLPGLQGDALLLRLRGTPQAASRSTPAIALTADPDPAVHRVLCGRGFAAVATKPLTLAALARLIDGLPDRAVQAPPIDARSATAALPCWDDAAALVVTGGDPIVLDTLRRLMLDDLPRQRGAIVAALGRGNPDAARSELHRLRAACGFCGATALATRAEALQAALDHAPGDALAEFERAVDALLT